MGGEHARPVYSIVCCALLLAVDQTGQEAEEGEGECGYCELWRGGESWQSAEEGLGGMVVL